MLTKQAGYWLVYIRYWCRTIESKRELMEDQMKKPAVIGITGLGGLVGLLISFFVPPAQSIPLFFILGFLFGASWALRHAEDTLRGMVWGAISAVVISIVAAVLNDYRADYTGLIDTILLLVEKLLAIVALAGPSGVLIGDKDIQ